MRATVVQGEWLQLALAVVVVLGTANSCFFYWGTGPFVAMTNSDPKVVEVATLVGRMLIPGDL